MRSCSFLCHEWELHICIPVERGNAFVHNGEFFGIRLTCFERYFERSRVNVDGCRAYGRLEFNHLNIVNKEMGCAIGGCCINIHGCQLVEAAARCADAPFPNQNFRAVHHQCGFIVVQVDDVFDVNPLIVVVVEYLDTCGIFGCDFGNTTGVEIHFQSPGSSGSARGPCLQKVVVTYISAGNINLEINGVFTCGFVFKIQYKVVCAFAQYRVSTHIGLVCRNHWIFCAACAAVAAPAGPVINTHCQCLFNQFFAGIVGFEIFGDFGTAATADGRTVINQDTTRSANNPCSGPAGLVVEEFGSLYGNTHSEVVPVCAIIERIADAFRTGFRRTADPGAGCSGNVFEPAGVHVAAYHEGTPGFATIGGYVQFGFDAHIKIRTEGDAYIFGTEQRLNHVGVSEGKEGYIPVHSFIVRMEYAPLICSEPDAVSYSTVVTCNTIFAACRSGNISFRYPVPGFATVVGGVEFVVSAEGVPLGKSVVVVKEVNYVGKRATTISSTFFNPCSSTIFSFVETLVGAGVKNGPAGVGVDSKELRKSGSCIKGTCSPCLPAISRSCEGIIDGSVV